MIKKLYLLIIPFCVFFLSISSCNTLEPVTVKPKINISLEGISSTEAWIKLIIEGLTSSESVNLRANDSLIFRLTSIKEDTLLYIDSLLPNTMYNFQAEIQSDNGAVSNKIINKTLDTTSHKFTWETFTFGEHSSSVIYDVAIINENDIWAVGEIYLNDSLGIPDPTAYNAVHWNGFKWDKKKVLYFGECSNIQYPALSSIKELTNNDVVITNGGSTALFNGNSISLDCRTNELLMGMVRKMWGESNENFYLVGDNGTITHKNSNKWQKIKTGTQTNINDIWGGSANIKLILCAVSNKVTQGDYKILSIHENEADSISWNTNRRVHSIWFEDNLKIFACGGGIFINNCNGKWVEQKEVPLISTNRVRGNGKNDVFVCGDYGLITHYNGATWKVYPEANAALFYSLDCKGNLAVAVGERNGKAVITMGHR